MVMKLGELVKLSNNRNYTVIYQLDVLNKKYVVLATVDTPFDIKIGTIKPDGDAYILELIKSKEEAQYVLDVFSYQNSN